MFLITNVRSLGHKASNFVVEVEPLDEFFVSNVFISEDICRHPQNLRHFFISCGNVTLTIWKVWECVNEPVTFYS